MTTMLKKVSRWLAAVAVSFVGLTAQAGITYFHNDIAGSPVAATNEAGQVIWRESYRPYGERRVNSAAASGNKVWFTSRRQDAETGLVYMGARYYDPVIGRFISTDPVGFDEQNVHSFNRYAYANNNPYRYNDPDGRVTAPLVVVAGGVVAGAVALQMVPEHKKRELAANLQRGMRELYGMFNESGEKQDGADSGEGTKPEGKTSPGEDNEKTPSTDPERFNNVRGTKAKKDKETGEIWEKDRLHKDHYEVYGNKKEFDQGRRDRSVWEDGRPKEKF